MICIVLGHMGISKVNAVVYPFHLPLFFYISGYFFTIKKDWSSFLADKASRLIIPYCFTCLWICILAISLTYIQNGSCLQTAKHWIAASLYGIGGNATSPFRIPGIGAIWFLWAIFWGYLLLRIYVTFFNKIFAITLSVTVALICIISSRYIWLPLSIQQGGAAALLMYMGYMYRQEESKLKTLSSEVRIFATLVLLALFAWEVTHFSGFWMVRNYYGNGIVDLLSSLGGVIAVCLLAKALKNIPYINHFLSIWGKWSLFVLCIHIIELNTLPWKSICQHTANFIGKEAGENCLYPIIIAKLTLISISIFFVNRYKNVRRMFGTDWQK